MTRFTVTVLKYTTFWVIKLIVIAVQNKFSYRLHSQWIWICYTEPYTMCWKKWVYNEKSNCCQHFIDRFKFPGTTHKLQLGENIFVIEALLCLNASVNKGCQKSTSTNLQKSTKCKYFSINSIVNNPTSDKLKDRNTEEVPNSVCLQQYSNYSISGITYEVPSGCKCHGIKFIWNYIL